jgi:hypothetical protein
MKALPLQGFLILSVNEKFFTAEKNPEEIRAELRCAIGNYSADLSVYLFSADLSD